MDRISDLSDCVLGYILSLLPLKERGRSAVLCKRWRHLWTILPLSLDASEFAADHDEGEQLARSIEQILTAHRGLVLSFRLASPGMDYSKVNFERWVKTLMQRGLKDLTLTLSAGIHWPGPTATAPAYLFANRCLRSLRLISTYVMDSSLQKIDLKNLRLLFLEKSFVESPETIRKLILGCPSLESLQLASVNFFTGQASWKVVISSPTLRCLSLDSMYINLLLIEDTPNFRRLMLIKGRHRILTFVRKIKILNAPRLEQLGFVDLLAVGKLVFGLQTLVQDLMVHRLREPFHGLKALAISMKCWMPNQEYTILNLLHSFPCLESFEVLYDKDYGAQTLENWEEEGDLNIDCLNRHLRSVTFRDCFSWQTIALGLANFLVARGRKLEVMTFCSTNWAKEDEKSFVRSLQLKNQVSPALQIVFRREEDDDAASMKYSPFFEEESALQA